MCRFGIIVFAWSLAIAPALAEVENVAGRSIMAIFAHPDDESTVAPALAFYARLGAKIQIVIATDGRYGTNDFSGLEEGDELAAIRRKEMQCAADTLGADLIHLDYHDQLRAAEGYDGHIPHVRALLMDVHRLITEYKPDVIITWGPDGGSNHMDHRLVGATVSNVFLSQQWHESMSLFYVGTPADRIDNEHDRMLRGVDSSNLDTSVSFGERGLRLAHDALRCHASQFSPQMLENWYQSRKDRELKIYLRRFATPQGRSTSLFD